MPRAPCCPARKAPDIFDVAGDRGGSIERIVSRGSQITRALLSQVIAAPPEHGECGADQNATGVGESPHGLGPDLGVRGRSYESLGDWFLLGHVRYLTA